MNFPLYVVCYNMTVHFYPPIRPMPLLAKNVLQLLKQEEIIHLIVGLLMELVFKEHQVINVLI